MHGNNIGPSGTTAIANALTNNTSLEELYMGGTRQDGATVITNSKMIKELLFGEHVAIDKESAMIIIKSLYNNNTITKLSLRIKPCQSDAILVTEEAEQVNSMRKLSSDHIIDFMLHFTHAQSQLQGSGIYTTEHKLSWKPDTAYDIIFSKL